MQAPHSRSGPSLPLGTGSASGPATPTPYGTTAAGRFAPVRVCSIRGLLAACWNLAAAGCRALLLDGSFVTAKPVPGDYDGAWETEGVDPEILDPVLLDFSDGRAAMKAKYLGDLFPASAVAEPGVLFRDFFRTDREGVEKGVVLVNLGSLP